MCTGMIMARVLVLVPEPHDWGLGFGNGTPYIAHLPTLSPRGPKI